MTRNPDLPDLSVVLPELVQRVPSEEQPFLIALLERFAADRYRHWSGQVEEPAQREGLLACAKREEEIARRVEGVRSDGAAVPRAILERHPDLPELNRSLFAPFSLRDQLTLQAEGERAGAAAWRAIAEQTSDAAARETFLGNALLEEENASFVESIRDDVPS